MEKIVTAKHKSQHNKSQVKHEKATILLHPTKKSPFTTENEEKIIDPVCLHTLPMSASCYLS